MKLLRVLICGLLLQGCAGFKEWSSLDKGLYISGGILHGIDTAQTQEVFRNPNYRELNPLFDAVGEDATLVLQLAWYPVVYYLADKFPEYRTQGLVVLNIISGLVVINNHSVGIRIGGEF